MKNEIAIKEEIVLLFWLKYVKNSHRYCLYPVKMHFIQIVCVCAVKMN